MADNNKSDEVDLLALLHEVHGSEAGARSEAMDSALRAMEVTHRQASLAMRQFERSGRVGNAPRPQAVPPVPVPVPASAPVPAQQTPPLPLSAQASLQPAAQPQRAEEVTAVWRPPPASPGAAAQPPNPDGARPAHEPGPQAAPPASAPPQVFAGKGAQVRMHEPTKTQVFARKKK